MTETKPTFTANIEPPLRSNRARLSAIADALDALHNRAGQLRQVLTGLRIEGLANATIHWDQDRHGVRCIMKLLHRKDSPTAPATNRRREYIGKSKARQRQARDRVQRWQEYERLRAELAEVERRIAAIERGLTQLELAAGAKQASLPGFKDE